MRTLTMVVTPIWMCGLASDKSDNEKRNNDE
jgi:hypothetical protein